MLVFSVHVDQKKKLNEQKNLKFYIQVQFQLIKFPYCNQVRLQKQEDDAELKFGLCKGVDESNFLEKQVDINAFGHNHKLLYLLNHIVVGLYLLVNGFYRSAAGKRMNFIVNNKVFQSLCLVVR